GKRTNLPDAQPSLAQPWKKIFTGGSDDHGGKFPASAYTETPQSPSAKEFLQHVQDGECVAHGEGGTPLALSHGFYNTVSCFIQDRFTEGLGPTAPLLEIMFSRFMEGRDPTEFTLREKATFVAQGVMSGKIFELAKPANVSLWNELSRYFARPEVKEMIAREVEVVAETERRAILFSNIVTDHLAFG